MRHVSLDDLSRVRRILHQVWIYALLSHNNHVYSSGCLVVFYGFTSSLSNQLGRWTNGSEFVFCAGDCPFKSEQSPTSVDVVEKRLAVMLTAKRMACVAPEVDLGECSLHSPPQKS